MYLFGDLRHARRKAPQGVVANHALQTNAQALHVGLHENSLDGFYYVARARPAGARAAEIKAAFNLSDIVPGDAQVEQARQSLSAPSIRLMQTVAQAIREMVVRGAPAIGCAAAFGIALEPKDASYEVLAKISSKASTTSVSGPVKPLRSTLVLSANNARTARVGTRSGASRRSIEPSP